MPFTFAHPIAIWPLRNKLPVSALALGAMVPDYGIFDLNLYLQTHNWRGIFKFDIFFALLLLLLWEFLIKDALLDASPTWIRQRVASGQRLSLKQWLWAPVAAGIGAATHIFWDSFTHAGRFGTRHFPVLNTEFAGSPGHRWLQHLSTLVGLSLILVWWVSWLRKRTKLTPAPRILPFWLAPVYLLLLGFVVLVRFKNANGSYWQAVEAGTVLLGGLTLGAIGLGICYRILKRQLIQQKAADG